MIEITKFEELSFAVFAIVSEGTAPIAIQEINTAGREIDSLGEIISAPSGLFTVLPNGTIKKVVLYIADTDESLGYGMPKFHVYRCRTIDSMESQNRSFRYKISSRTDGKFRLTLTTKYSKNSRSTDAALEICMNCLTIYNSRNQKITQKAEFSNNLLSFINGAEVTGLKESGFTYDWDLIPNQYKPDWHLISAEMKRKRGYRCEYCGWIANAATKKYLHAHHLNGKVYENSETNIKILCIECHGQQEGIGHAKIKSSAEYIEFSFEIKGKSK